MKRYDRPGGWLPVALAVAAICIATLRPIPQQAAESAATPWSCIVCGELGAVDVILNVLLFVPLGAALAHAGSSWRRALLLGSALSLSVELLQATIVFGRDASVGDFLTNSLGTVLGALLARRLPAWLRPTPRAAARLAAVWAMAWLGQTAVTAYAVLPSLPRSVYWGQIAADLPQFARFEGRVLAARIDSLGVPDGRMRHSEAVRDALLAGGSVQATAVAAGPTPRLAPVVSVFDEARKEIVLLGQSGRSLVFRLRSHAEDLRLRPPAIRLPNAFGRAGGDTLELDGRLRGAMLEVGLRRGAHALRRDLALDAQWGWSLLLPFHYYAGPEAGPITAVWIAGWLLPLGFWVARSGINRAGAVGALGGTLIVGLGAVPAAFGLGPTAWGGWVAGAVAAGIGALLGRKPRYAAGKPPRARSAASP